MFPSCMIWRHLSWKFSQALLIRYVDLYLDLLLLADIEYTVAGIYWATKRENAQSRGIQKEGNVF